MIFVFCSVKIERPFPQKQGDHDQNQAILRPGSDFIRNREAGLPALAGYHGKKVGYPSWQPDDKNESDSKQP